MHRRDPFVESALSSLEEMRHFPSQEARDRAIREHIAFTNRPVNLVFGTLYIAAVVVFTQWILRIAARSLLPNGTPMFIRPVIVVVGTITVYYLFLGFLHKWGTARDLRKLLIKEGVPICLKCGYLLRGLPSSTESCPECGRRIPPTTRGLISRD